MQLSTAVLAALMDKKSIQAKSFDLYHLERRNNKM